MNNHPYRINVGFLINAPVGTYRDFELSESSMELADDLHADEIRCTVRASRVQQGILATADCSAKTELECTRCLEPFETAVERLGGGIKAENCLAVGDRYDMDIKLPLEMGMGGILVSGVEEVYQISKSVL